MSNPRLSVIPAGAVTDPHLEGRDLQVLCLLGRHIDSDSGWCRRSQVKMSKELRCARSTVQASLDRLIDAGWVQRRVEVRPSGGDAAHSYRVILDRDDASAAFAAGSDHDENDDGGADLSAGVPTQERQGVPIQASAPMLTTPLNEKERGSAGEPEGEGPEGRPTVTYPRLRAAWPNSAADDHELGMMEWERLTVAQRNDCFALLPDFLAFYPQAKGSKAKLPHLNVFLRQHRWEDIARLKQEAREKAKTEAAAKPPDQVAVLAARSMKLFSRSLTWVIWRRLERDPRSAGKLIDLAESYGGSCMVQPDEVPTDEQEQQLVRLDAGGPQWRAWVGHVLRRYGVRLPTPTHAPYVWAPSEWPPEQSAEASQHAMAKI